MSILPAISSLVVEPGQPGGRVPEGRSQIVALARDAFAVRWREMADDVVSKNLMSSLELAMPDLVLFGVEPADMSLGVGLSPAVSASLDDVIQEVISCATAQPEPSP